MSVEFLAALYDTLQLQVTRWSVMVNPFLVIAAIDMVPVTDLDVHMVLQIIHTVF